MNIGKREQKREKRKLGSKGEEEGNWESRIAFSCVMSGGCTRVHIRRINGNIL